MYTKVVCFTVQENQQKMISHSIQNPKFSEVLQPNSQKGLVSHSMKQLMTLYYCPLDQQLYIFNQVRKKQLFFKTDLDSMMDLKQTLKQYTKLLHTVFCMLLVLKIVLKKPVHIVVTHWCIVKVNTTVSME